MAFGDSSNLLSSFTGPNESPISEGGKWAKLDTVTAITLNRTGNAVTSSGATTGESYWTVQNFGPNVEAYLTITVMPGDGNNIDVSARILQPGGNSTYDGYRVRMLQVVGTDTLQLTRVDNGAITNIGTPLTRDFAAGEKIGIQCQGNVISGWYNDGTGWILGTQTTDNTYPASGAVAVHVRGTTGRADDMYAGTLLTFGSLPHVGGRGAT